MKTNWMAVIALLAGSSVALAEGEFEIDQACVTVGCFPGDAPGFPVTLANNGVYRLTSDLIVNTSDGISVSAARVEIDLAGFEIFGGGSCSGNGATLSCSGGVVAAGIVQNAVSTLIHLHDGTIRGMGGSAMVLSAVASGSTIERLTMSENAASAAITGSSPNGGVAVTQLNYSRNGFALNLGNAAHVQGSEFSNNRFQGVVANQGSTVTESTFVGNGSFAVQCGAASTICALGRNSFFGNNGAGTNPQFSTFIVRDMGGNVCEDGTCP